MLKTEIKKFLKRTGLKAYNLADLAKVSRPTLYRFLKGDRTITLETADKISRAIKFKTH